MPLINKHLPCESAVTITDGHKSFQFLEYQRRHFWCKKRKTGHSLWLEVDEVMLKDWFEEGAEPRKMGVHTNTIEGFWSHFRRELRGVQDNTLHLYMADVMFRRLGISLACAISS